MDTIHLDHVTWSRDGQTVVRDVSWTVRKGEHWALIGANGSGKTTLLNLVNGYLWPSSGAISVLGQQYGACLISEVRKSIGWVSHSLVERVLESQPWETAFEVVLSGKFASVGLYEDVTDDDRDRAANALRLFDCMALSDRPFHQLSQGEQQRVLISRAWMANPRLLILDEPCTGLDLPAREHLLGTVNALTSTPNGPTLIYVTHHPEELVPGFTHALLLRDGQTVAAGEKTEVLTDSMLSATFGIPVELSWHHGRPWVRVAPGNTDIR